MSLSNERVAIETYFTTQWGGATATGYDGHKFTPVADSVLLVINSGRAFQGSIGRAANRIDNVGVLSLKIFTEGGKGSDTARGYAETIITAFHEKTLDSSGVVITATEDAFLRFSPPQLGENGHPYVSASGSEPNFYTMTVSAPFVRYEYR